MAYRLVIAPNQIENSTVSLTEPQRHYLQRVLRLKGGDKFVVLDGTGKVWQAKFDSVDAQLVEPITEENELPLAVTLAVALPKGNGFEDIIRPCTELGATAFQPLLTERTLLQPSDNKLQRWQRIVTEAAEQSERQWVPPIATPLNFAEFLGILNNLQGSETLGLLCVTRRNSPMLGAYLKQDKLPSQVIVATGPEGGWTDQEIALAIAKGFQPVSLGKRILRAVTASTVALAQISALVES